MCYVINSIHLHINVVSRVAIVKVVVQLEGPWHCDIWIMWLVKELESIQVHFTIDLEGTGDHVNWNRWKIYMTSSGHDIALGPSKRGGSTARLWIEIVIHSWKYYIDVMGPRTWTHVAVPQHAPISLNLQQSEGSINCKIETLFPTRYNLYVVFRGPSIFMVLRVITPRCFSDAFWSTK